ncbi:MAG: PLP-dependent aminotransferase family protein [Acidobacteria bacterium]|nr:PLP-dependent aminotransferase family protein [Acidobacteriota bacterium]
MDLDKFSSASHRLRPNVIRQMIALTHGKSLISFAGGLPSPESFPVAEIVSVVRDLLAEKKQSALQYGPTQGSPELLEQLRLYMHSRGVQPVEVKNLLVTAGSQQALDLLTRLFVDPGDVVIVELPSYIGAITAFRNLGAELVGVQQDREGMVPEDLEATMERLQRQGRRVAFLYTVPNFSNPSGVLMTGARREALLTIARKFGLWIVEDDAYGEIYFSDCDAEEVRPLSAWEDRENIIYVGTFSKTLAPGLRVGWVCARPEVISRLELFKQGADLFASSLNQRIAAELMARGTFQQRLPGLRTQYERRRDAMRAALDAAMAPVARWNHPRGGFFVWLEVDPGLDTAALMGSAIDAGVAYIPGQPFHVDGSGANTIRLAFSSESEENIREGISKLSRFLQSVSPAKSPV